MNNVNGSEKMTGPIAIDSSAAKDAPEASERNVSEIPAASTPGVLWRTRREWMQPMLTSPEWMEREREFVGDVRYIESGSTPGTYTPTGLRCCADEGFRNFHGVPRKSCFMDPYLRALRGGGR
jgi:hypothetical protein